MKRILSISLGMASLFLAVGCGNDYQANQIIEENTSPGKISESLMGSPEQMTKTGRIDFHLVTERPNGVNIDTWVMCGKIPMNLNAPGEGTVVLLHGLGESKASFPYFGAAQVLAQRGYDVALIDLRAHGRSTGKYITYGALEKEDVKAVVDELLRKGMIRSPIYVFGSTLGGATAIQYAAIDSRCRGVMAMNPYRDARSIARRKLVFSSEEEFEKALARAGEIAGFDPETASSVDAASQLRIPVLLAHGLLNISVPKEHSDAIFEQLQGPKKLIVITPGPEQLALLTVMEDWIADKMDDLIRNQLQEAAPVDTLDEDFRIIEQEHEKEE